MTRKRHTTDSEARQQGAPRLRCGRQARDPSHPCPASRRRLSLQNRIRDSEARLGGKQNSAARLGNTSRKRDSEKRLGSATRKRDSKGDSEARVGSATCKEAELGSATRKCDSEARLGSAARRLSGYRGRTPAEPGPQLSPSRS